MKKFILFGAILLPMSFAYGQYQLKGQVLEKTSNEILAGATVVLKPTLLASSTDKEGKFIFSNLPSGSYYLEVSFVGYASLSDSIEIWGDLDLSLKLSPSNSWTDEVIVNATKAEENSPTVFVNVPAEYLEKNNLGQDMPYLLNWTPSVVTTSDAGNGIGYTGMRIRGSDQSRINVTINGIPYNDSESQGVYWVDIPDMASSTKNIQIQRGVGTSTNGAGAFGGSVNLQTHSINTESYGQVEGAYGSFNSRKFSAQAGTGLIADHWVFDGRLSLIGSDGYIERASSDLQSYFASGAYVGKKTVLKLLSFGGREKTYQSWYGVDEQTLKSNRTYNPAGWVSDSSGNTRFFYDNQVDDYSQDHLQLHLSQSLSRGLTVNAALHYTYGRGYFEEYMDVNQGWETNLSFYNLDPIILGNDTINETDLIRRKWLDNDFYGLTGSLEYKTQKAHFVVGLAANQYDGGHYGELVWARYASNSEIRHRFYDNDAVKKDFTTYAKLTYQVSSRLSLFGDLQYRGVRYQVKGTDAGNVPLDISDDFNFFNPKAGFNYGLGRLSNLFFSVAVGNKEPNRTDYIENLGNEKPKNETLYDFELGFRRKGKQAAFEIVGYYMYYKNQLVLTGAYNNVGQPIRENVGKSYRAGVELSGEFHFSPKWRWIPNLTISDNKQMVDQPASGPAIPQAHGVLAFSPGVIVGSDFSFLPVKGLELALLSKYVSSQWMDNGTVELSNSLSPYFINDFRIRYLFSISGIKEIGVTLMVNNIMDVEYSSNGYVYFGQPYFFPQAGRNYLLGLRVKF